MGAAQVQRETLVCCQGLKSVLQEKGLHVADVVPMAKVASQKLLSTQQLTAPLVKI